MTSTERRTAAAQAEAARLRNQAARVVIKRCPDMDDRVIMLGMLGLLPEELADLLTAVVG